MIEDELLKQIRDRVLKVVEENPHVLKDPRTQAYIDQIKCERAEKQQ